MVKIIFFFFVITSSVISLENAIVLSSPIGWNDSEKIDDSTYSEIEEYLNDNILISSNSILLKNIELKDINGEFLRITYNNEFSLKIPTEVILGNENHIDCNRTFVFIISSTETQSNNIEVNGKNIKFISNNIQEVYSLFNTTYWLSEENNYSILETDFGEFIFSFVLDSYNGSNGQQFKVGEKLGEKKRNLLLHFVNIDDSVIYPIFIHLEDSNL